MHPDNSFNIARWKGNDDDSQLYDLINFLKSLLNTKESFLFNYKINIKFFLFSAIATTDVDDVRDVLHYYRQFEDPIMKFRENQAKLLEQMQEREREEKAKSKPIVKNWTRSFLGR